MVTVFYINDGVASGFKRLDYDIFKELGYSVLVIEVMPTPRGFIWALPKICNVLRAHKKDEGKIFYSWFAYNCHGSLLGAMLRIPSIIVAGGNDVSNDPHAKLGPEYVSFFSKKMVDFGLKYSTKVIVVSNFTKERVFALGAHLQIDNLKSKTYMIYNAIDEMRLGHSSRENHLQFKYNYFITSGYLTENNLIQKGYRTILTAVETNKTWFKENKIKMFFFGNECGNCMQDEIKKRNLEDFAEVVPYKNETLPLYLANAIAYLQISTHETFGVSMVEAMAVGCPVIASNVTALPEIAGDAALYVEPNNPKQLAEKMVELYENKKMRHMLGERGKKRVDKYFSKEIRKKQLKELIETTINEGCL